MDWKIPAVLAVAALAVAGAVMVTMNKNDSKDRSDDAIIPPDVEPGTLDGARLAIKGPNGTIYADFADTAAANELRNTLSKGTVSVNLHDYGSFEKVGEIGVKLTSSDTHTSTGPGDIVLYSGDQIVIFYGNNSWDYTRLAKVPDATNESMHTFLGNGNVILELSLQME